MCFGTQLKRNCGASQRCEHAMRSKATGSKKRRDRDEKRKEATETEADSTPNKEKLHAKREARPSTDINNPPKA